MLLAIQIDLHSCRREAQQRNARLGHVARVEGAEREGGAPVRDTCEGNV
jgi:hypothetical protein